MFWTEASGVVDPGIWTSVGVQMTITTMTDDGAGILGIAEFQSSGWPIDTFEWSGEFVVHPADEFVWGVSGDGQRRLLAIDVVPNIIEGGSDPIAVTTYLESLGMDLSPWRTVRPDRISRSGTALAGWIVPVGVSG